MFFLYALFLACGITFSCLPADSRHHLSPSDHRTLDTSTLGNLYNHPTSKGLMSLGLTIYGSSLLHEVGHATVGITTRALTPLSIRLKDFKGGADFAYNLNKPTPKTLLATLYAGPLTGSITSMYIGQAGIRETYASNLPFYSKAGLLLLQGSATLYCVRINLVNLLYHPENKLVRVGKELVLSEKSCKSWDGYFITMIQEAYKHDTPSIRALEKLYTMGVKNIHPFRVKSRILGRAMCNAGIMLLSGNTVYGAAQHVMYA